MVLQIIPNELALDLSLDRCYLKLKILYFFFLLPSQHSLLDEVILASGLLVMTIQSVCHTEAHLATVL